MGFLKKIFGGPDVSAQVDAANKAAEATRKQTAAIQQQIGELAKQNATIASANEKGRQDSLKAQQDIENQRRIAEEAAKVRQENLTKLETKNAAGDQLPDVNVAGTAETVAEESTPAQKKKKKANATKLSTTLGIGV